MQREILFKAKRKDNQEWVYGYYAKSSNKHYILDIACVIEQYSEYYERDVLIPEYYEVIPETICQYTGLNDRVGDKIFENDILREYSNEIEDWIVSYEYGKFVGTCDNVCEDLWEIHDMEVIGNIYDKEGK